MRKLSLLACALTVSFTAFAQTPFDRAKERARMLAILETPPLQSLEIQGLDKASPEQRAFLEFFRDRIWPPDSQLEKLSLLDGVLHVARDRALYDSEAEKNEWKARIKQANNEIAKIRTSKERQNNIREWAKLSEGLSGPLADYARRRKADMELAAFTEREMPLLERVNSLEQEIYDISNTSPIASKLAATTKAINQTTEDYFSGRISFGTAWRIIEAYQTQGRAALGHDVAARGAAHFEELARLRSQLAKSKGFKTWAAYVLATQARNYAEGYKTAEEKLAFLNKILIESKDVYVEFLKKRLSLIPGASLEELRSSQTGLLALETDTLVREYFPVDRAEALWQQVMLESGFPKEMLDQIVLDAFPRDGKQTHAYMSDVSGHGPKVFRVHAENLSVESPSDQRDWFQSNIFIVQNFRDDGTDSVETMFHEGGHATDYYFREDLLGNGSAYGYTEVHSMMMERVLKDIEFLMAKGINREGKPMPREIAEAFVLNSRINSIAAFRGQVANAILDIDVWNYDYDAPNAESFVERMRAIRGHTVENASLAKGQTIDGIDSRSSAFSTSHFYSGSVRYFGYIVADIGAEMSAETLWDEFEKETGRRSFLNQPTLAQKVIQRYYRKGFLLPFPLSVEAFNGKPYSPAAILAAMIEAVKKYDPKKPSCREILALSVNAASR